METRTTPLTRIRGINTAIEERLGEEGIENVEMLASVEPIRLLRDTPFDLRNILWWIDEALLMMYVPQRWQLLEEQGITGAIDLADLANQEIDDEEEEEEEEEEEVADEEEEEEEEDETKSQPGAEPPPAASVTVSPALSTM